MFDYLQMQELHNCYRENPILEVLIFKGFIALTIIVWYFYNQLDKQEDKAAIIKKKSTVKGDMK